MLHHELEPQQKTPDWITDSIEDLKKRLDQAKYLDTLPHDIEIILKHTRATFIALEQGAVEVRTQIIKDNGPAYIVTEFSTPTHDDFFTTTDI